ncbi:MAG: serine/threonine protein kinase [Candidatus Brocadiae bacterium]|nr:serine/threonine protein kinase [Candidatus Brocadiia bacterium]
MSEIDAGSLEGLQFHSSSTYHFVHEIGRGGMGIVYLAEKDCEGVTDYVVLKTIRQLSKEQEDRLKHEANIAAGLRHENIVKTYGLESIPYMELPEKIREALDNLSFDSAKAAQRVSIPSFAQRRAMLDGRPVGQTGMEKPVVPLRPPVRRLQPVVHVMPKKQDPRKLYLLAMDYVEGTDLRSFHMEHLDKFTLIPPPLTAFIISRICRALAYAHDHIVHRDVTPENILVNNQGVAKLTDFGVAVTGKEALQMFAGKLNYMSPEQVRQQELDGRSDLFSLGLVAYEVLTGINLLSTPRGMPLMQQIQYLVASFDTPFPPAHEVRKDIPEVLSNIVMKMLAIDRDKRYRNAQEVGNDLEMKYLYAAGFGPTNNSLASYMKIFDMGWKLVSQDQMRQLAFLKGRDGRIELKRELRLGDFTKTAWEWIKERKGTALYSALAQLQQMTKA